MRISKQKLVFGLSALRTAFLLGLLFAATSGPSAATRGSDAMVLGVHPYLSYSEIRIQFDPLADYLTQQLGIDVNVRVGNSYDDHIEQIGRNQIEFAYIGPVGYVKLIERYGPKPLLAVLQTQGGNQLAGHFVVRDQGPLQGLPDLAGHSLGLGDPNSTMSSVVPTAVLQNAGIDLDSLASTRRYRGHNSIAIAVLSGQVDAGAVKDEVFQRYASQGLRSLAQLPPVTEHLFVASATLDQDTIKQLRTAMLELHHTQEGRRVLTALHPKATALIPVEDSDYDAVRAIVLPRD